MSDDALGALVRDSAAWPASGPSASFAGIAQRLDLDQLHHLDDCLGKLSAGQLCVNGQLRDSTAYSEPEAPPVTHDLPFALACGLRIARVVNCAAGPVSEGLPSGASATGSTATGHVRAPSVQPTGKSPSASDSFQLAAPAATEGEGAGDTSPNMPPAKFAAMHTCSGIGRTSARSAQPSVKPIAQVAKCDHHACGRLQPCHCAGSALPASESMCAGALDDAAMAQSWREPHEDGHRSAALRSIADRSGELEAAWMWQFMQPTALTTALGLGHNSKNNCQPDPDVGDASEQLPWHQKAVAALQLLEVLLDSCVLGEHIQMPHAAAHTGAKTPPVLHLLQLHLHVRDIISQHPGKATTNDDRAAPDESALHTTLDEMHSS